MPYKKRINLPEPPEGVIYKDMGVQENQNCTLITLRMKHGRMRWSVAGADAMAKVLAAKSNGVLKDYIYGTYPAGEAKKDTESLSAAKIQPVIAKNKNIYADIISRTIPLLNYKNAGLSNIIRNLC